MIMLKKLRDFHARNIILVSILLPISACGGGGGSSDDNETNNTNIVTENETPDVNTDNSVSDTETEDSDIEPTADNWVNGFFNPATNYKNKCVVPRYDVTSSGQRLYTDQQGVLLDELNWLRSWSHETYLWHDETIDQNPALFNSPLTYFDSLKTPALTEEGNPKDSFHFYIPTESYNQLIQDAESISYGVHLVLTQATPPRRLMVAYVEKNSSAALAGLQRGDSITGIDGIDLVNTNNIQNIDSINAALSPNNPGDSHIFRIQHHETGQIADIALTAQTVTTEPVHTTKLLETDNGQVGYLLFNSHIEPAEDALRKAIQQFAAANVSDLVVDLRYNGGGQIIFASQLAYMIAGEKAHGKVFAHPRYNDKWTVRDFNNEPIQPLPFINVGLGYSVSNGTALPELGLSRVFILTGAGTCSASEALINGLQGIDIETILIGEQTCGKPYGSYPTDNCGTTYSIIQLTIENAKGFGEYSDGFVPAHGTARSPRHLNGCLAADDFSHPLGHIQENRLATALTYRNTGQCLSAKPDAQLRKTAENNQVPSISVGKPQWLQHMILP